MPRDQAMSAADVMTTLLRLTSQSALMAESLKSRSLQAKLRKTSALLTMGVGLVEMFSRVGVIPDVSVATSAVREVGSAIGMSSKIIQKVAGQMPKSSTARIEGGIEIATVSEEIGEDVVIPTIMIEKLIGSLLSVLPELSPSEYSQLLPAVPKSTFKKFHDNHKKITEDLFVDFLENLGSLPAAHGNLLQKMVLGFVETAPVEEPELDVGKLKSIAYRLRHLKEADKRALVDAFTRACTNYSRSFKPHPSERSMYLMHYLAQATETSQYQDVAIRMFTGHKLDSKLLLLLQAPDFPNNMREQMLILGPEFKAICDPVKLQKEVERLKVKLKKENNDQVLTEKEMADLVEDFAAKVTVPGAPQPPNIQQVELNKILTYIKPEDVISDKVLQLSAHLQAGSPEESVDEKLEHIIEFLMNGDNKGRLVDMINPELQSIKPKLKYLLLAYHEQSMDYLVEAFHVQMKRELSLFEGAEIDRGMALAFYRAHLNDDKKTNELLKDFSESLAEDQKQPDVSMIKIAILLGMLDPKHDAEVIDAYKNVLKKMVVQLRQKVVSLPDNIEAARQFEAALSLLDHVTTLSFASRGERLEAQTKFERELTEKLRVLSRLGMFVGKSTVINPVIATKAALLSALLGCASAAIMLCMKHSELGEASDFSRPTSSVQEAREAYAMTQQMLEVVLIQEGSRLAQMEALLKIATISAEERAIFNSICDDIRLLISMAKEMQKNLSDLGDIKVKEDDNPAEVLEKTAAYLKKIEQCYDEFHNKLSPISERIQANNKAVNSLEEDQSLEALSKLI